MFFKVKNYIKYKNPKIYTIVRDKLFPFYLKVRAKRLDKFKTNNIKKGDKNYVNNSNEKTIKNINFAGVKYKLVLDKANGFVDEEIYWKGVYEEEVMLALQKEIELTVYNINNKKENTNILFLDIGSNIGQELIFVGSMGVRSYGFEPLPHLYCQVNESIKINNLENNVYIYNFALGDSNQELILKSPVINIGGSSLVRNESNTVGELIDQKVKIRKGDTEISNIIKKINLQNKGINLQNKENNIKLIIKIDVEGYEYEVIKGLYETIKKYKPTIILEYSPAFYIKNSAIGDRSSAGVDMLQMLKEENYIMEIIDIGEYKNITYKGEEIINWGFNFKGEQANLLLYKK